jgi:hypothetical protein
MSKLSNKLPSEKFCTLEDCYHRKLTKKFYLKLNEREDEPYDDDQALLKYIELEQIYKEWKKTYDDGGYRILDFENGKLHPCVYRDYFESLFPIFSVPLSEQKKVLSKIGKIYICTCETICLLSDFLVAKHMNNCNDPDNLLRNFLLNQYTSFVSIENQKEIQRDDQEEEYQFTIDN